MNLTVDSSRTLSPLRISRPKGIVIGFWVVTVLLCLQLGFTAYAQLTLPQVAEAFTHLGFPEYFRVELTWAKLLGVVLLLAPVPARLKEWAYAGFAFTLVSALIAHLAVGDGRRRGALRWAPACSGRSRTFSGAAWRRRASRQMGQREHEYTCATNSSYLHRLGTSRLPSSRRCSLRTGTRWMLRNASRVTAASVTCQSTPMMPMAI
jgi:hypothetical protein